MLQNTQDFNAIDAAEKIDVADWRMSNYGLPYLVVIKDRMPVGRLTKSDVLEAQERHVEALLAGEEFTTADLTLDRLFFDSDGETPEMSALDRVSSVAWEELLVPSAGVDLAA